MYSFLVNFVIIFFIINAIFILVIVILNKWFLYRWKKHIRNEEYYDTSQKAIADIARFLKMNNLEKSIFYDF